MQVCGIFWNGAESVAVDQNMFGFYGKQRQGFVHGFHRSPKDVHFVYFFGRAGSNGKAQRLPLDDVAQFTALLFRKLLGVVQLRAFEIGWKDNGGGKDRSGKASATRLVAAGFDATGTEVMR